MGAVNHPRRLLGFLLAAALGLGALSCHNNSLPVAPLRSASLKVEVKVPTGVHASTNYELALLYVITGNGAAPVTGVQGPFSSASLSGTIDFSVDVSGAPSSRVMAFQLNDASTNSVVAIGASALNLTGEAQDLTVQLGSVTRTGYSVSGLSPPGSYGFDGNLISGLAQSQFGYDINVTGSSPNYQFASAYTPNNISYLGNGDIVNFAFVSSSPASFFANSTLAKNNAGLSATDLAVGDVFCVQLSTGGYAWVQITDVGVTGPSFFFRTNTAFPYFAYQQTTFDINYVTSTFTPSVTATPTFSSTPVFTGTSTDTPADTDTSTMTLTPTVTASPTDTASATNSPTAPFTATNSFTSTATATWTSTSTATSTNSSTSSFTATPSPTDTSTITNTFTDSPTITDTPTSTPTITQTSTDTSTITNSPTNSPTVTNTPTNTSTITDTPVFTYTVTDTPTITDTPTATSTITQTSTDTATVTDSPTNSFTITDTLTATGTSTNSATASSTGTATGTPTLTPTVTVTGTATQTWNPTVTGGVLSGSVTYTGALGSVDINHPIWVGLFNGASFNNPVTYALVNSNGGTYSLQSKVPGTYYIAISYEAFGGASSSPTGNGALSGNPFVVYGTPNNCVPGSGASVTLNQFSSGPDISFADDCKFEATTLTGTVSYSGSLGSVDAGHPLWVGLFTSADLTQVQGGPLTYTLVNSNNGTYNLVVPGPGRFYLAYSYEANGGPSSNPTGNNGNSGNPFRVYANAGANCSLVASQGVTLVGGAVAGPALNLDDSCLFAATSVTPTPTPTSSVIQLGFDGSTPVTVSGDTSISQDRYNQPIQFSNGGGDDDYGGSYTYYGQGSPDVAYSFHLNTAQSVFINLCGATFDSVVYVRTSLNDPNSTVAMDDDSNYCGAGFTSSSLVTGTLQPGTYYVIVDGYSYNDEGSYTMSLSSFTPNVALSPVSQPVQEVEPNNDDSYFENATNLGTVTANSDLVGQGKANYFTDEVDTWHFQVGSGNSTYTISLDGFDDGTGKVHLGFDLYQVGDGTNLIDSSSDLSEPNQITENLSSGDYYVVVYAFDEGAPGGDYKLVVQGSSIPTPAGTLTPTSTATITSTPTPTPTIPPVTEITVPSVGSVSVNGDTTSLGDNFSESVTLNDPDSENGYDTYAYGVGAPDQTYYFVPNQSESLYLYLSNTNFDSVIYVRTNPYDPTTTVALDDDSDYLNGTASSLVTGTLQAGVTYYVTVDGYSPSDKGTFTLNVGPFIPNCALAPAPTVVAEVEPNNDDNNFNNTTDLGQVSEGTTLEGAGSVNYYFDNVDTWNFTVNEDGNYTVSLDCFDDQTGKARLGFDLYEYGELINSSDDLTEPNQITQDLPPGNYQIAIYAFDAGAPSGDYKIFVQGSNGSSPTETPVFSYTATDTPTLTATPPPVVDVTSYIDNGSYTGDTTGAPDNYNQSVNNGDGYQTYGQGGPDAVYSFHLSEPKSLALYCASSFQSLIYVKTSPNNFSNTIAFDEYPYTDSETDSALVTGVLQPGTYYIVVDGYDSESFGPFTLSLATFNPNCALNPVSTPVMEIEPNNDDNFFTKATFLGNVGQGSDVVGQGHADSYFDPVDTWRFTVTSGGSYTISTDCFDDGTNRSFVGLDLYDSRGNFIDYSSDDGEPNQVVDTLQPGNYFVAVYANNQNAPSADYHLVVQGNGPATDTPTVTPTGTWQTPTDSPTVTPTLTVTGTPTAAITPTAIGTPITITGGPTTVTVSGDTTSGSDNFQQPLPNGDIGAYGFNVYGVGVPDLAYKIHLNNQMSLLINLCESSTYNQVIYLRTNLTDPNSAIALSDYSDCGEPSLVTGTLPAGDYYVIVDGVSKDYYTSSFSMNISQFTPNCSLSPNAASTITESEPNNDDTNFTNPNDLGSVSTGNDAVGSGKVNEYFDPVDTWKFTVGTAETCTISLDCFDDGNQTTHMGFDLYDSGHNLVDSSLDLLEPDQIIDNLPPGVYYLAVYPADQNGDYSVGGDYHLIVQAAASAAPTSATIPSDGTTMILNGTTLGALDSNRQFVPSDGVTYGKGEPDVTYALSVTQAGSFYIQCNGGVDEGPTLYPVIYLRTNPNDPNSAIGFDNSGYHDSENAALVTGLLPVGTYYLTVDGNFGGDAGAFNLNIASFNPSCFLSPAPNAAATIAEVEPNNDAVNFTKPTFLGTVSQGIDLLGSGNLNVLTDTVDTWHFKALTTGGTYTISLDCFDDGTGLASAQITLYDSRHNQITNSNYNSPGQPNQFIQFLPQGDYYIAVQSNNHQQIGLYHLAVQGSAPPTPTFTPTATSTPPYSAPTTWAINGATLNDPTGIALDGGGNAYVADFGNNRILKFDSSGTYQTQFADPSAGINFFPGGVAVNSEGTTVFTVDLGFEHRVDAFSYNAGTYSLAWSSSAISSGVAGVAVDNSGYVYATGGSEIQSNYLFKFLPPGASPINTWGPSGGPDQFNTPEAVAVNSSATTVYEADNYNYVNVYSFDGTNYSYQFQFSVPGIDGIGGMTLDGASNVYVTGRFGGQIVKLDPTGNVINELGDGSHYAGGVAVDGSGNIYESTGNGTESDNVILKYAPLP